MRNIPGNAAAVWLAIPVMLAPATLAAQEQEKDAEALAKQLSNPVASLISVPF